MKVEYLVIHHTAVSREQNHEQFEAVKNYHISKGWGNIGYHFFIEPNGVVKIGRAENEVGAHVKEQSMNYKSLGICLTGNFDLELPTAEQLQSLEALLVGLKVKYKLTINEIKFHRDYASYKSCPGTKFTRKLLEDLFPPPDLNNFNDNDMLVIKKQGDPVLYLAAGEMLVPFVVDFATYKIDFGKAKVIEVSATEFAKFTIAKGVKIGKK